MTFRSWLWIILLAGTATCGLRPAMATELPPVAVVPAKTTVMMLPVIDVGSHDVDRHPLYSQMASHQEQYEFLTRGFRCIGPSLSKSISLDVPGCDLSTQDGRNPDNFEALGKKAGADWVVNIVILDTDTDSWSPHDWWVHGVLRVQIWDVKRNGWISQFDYYGRKGSQGQAEGPMSMFDGVVESSVTNVLSNVLGYYPKTVTVLGEDRNWDYLDNQKAVFVPDPKSPFSGINPPE